LRRHSTSADAASATPAGATRRGFLQTSLAAGLGAVSAPALMRPGFAEGAFPSRPIEILVPWGAGGGPSTISEMVRSVAQEEKLSAQPMVLNHKPGASGMIGAALVARRKGDPYVFMPGGGALLLQAVTKAFDIHPVTGLTPLALSTLDSSVVVVREDSPFRTFDDFLQAARKAPRAVSIAAVGGSYSFDDLTTKVLNLVIGSELNQIPFGGGAEVQSAVLGGQVDAGSRQLANAINLIQARQMRALCVFDPVRNPLLPDTPTMKELGFDYAYQLPRAWFGPPGLGKAEIAWYDTLFRKISEAPKFVQWVDSSASLNRYMGSAEFTDFIDQTMATFDRLFKQMGLIK
jgi:putative tricarboxylic transport membrane protein